MNRDLVRKIGYLYTFWPFDPFPVKTSAQHLHLGEMYRYWKDVKGISEQEINMVEDESSSSGVDYDGSISEGSEKLP